MNEKSFIFNNKERYVNVVIVITGIGEKKFFVFSEKSAFYQTFKLCFQKGRKFFVNACCVRKTQKRR